MYRKYVVLLGLLIPHLTLAQQEVSQDKLRELLAVKIRTVQHMALNPTVIRSVRKQNSQKVSLKEIKQRDDEWKNTDELTPFKRTLQEIKVGRFLRGHVEKQGGSFNEAFLTDNQGANVAAFPATSDYWQGDEEKWVESFNSGDGRLFLGPLEFDESTKQYAVQVSAPVLDRGATIGVLVVGVTLDYLESKQAPASN